MTETLSDHIREWKKDGDVDDRAICYSFGWRDLDELDQIIKQALKDVQEKFEVKKFWNTCKCEACINRQFVVTIEDIEEVFLEVFGSQLLDTQQGKGGDTHRTTAKQRSSPEESVHKGEKIVNPVESYDTPEGSEDSNLPKARNLKETEPSGSKCKHGFIRTKISTCGDCMLETSGSRKGCDWHEVGGAYKWCGKNGYLCPECSSKGCGKEYIGTKETCGEEGCLHHCGDGTYFCPECNSEGKK